MKKVDLKKLRLKKLNFKKLDLKRLRLKKFNLKKPNLFPKHPVRIQKRFLLSAITCLLLCSTASTYALAEYYTVGVAVQYNGSPVGVVQDSGVVQTAKKILNEQLVTDEAVPEALPKTEEQHMSIAKKQDLMDEETLADAFVTTSDELIPAAAIFVDGDFYAAVDEPEAAEEVLDEVLQERSTGAKDEQLDFTEKVEVVEGICATDELSDSDSVKKEVKENLDVEAVRTEVRTEEVPYDTQTVESEDYPEGVQVVTQEGVNGSAKVTEEVTCINEVETERRVLTTEVQTEAVEKVVTVGTGSFQLVEDVDFLAMPLEGSYLSSPYGGRWGRNHNGLDLCLSGGTLGADILAVYGGTVTTAQHSNSGYGNMVELDHGNGYTTLYAHMTDLTVEEGDIVEAGSLVGHAGSTGNSTGPHLHFEIRQDGDPVDPLPYLPDVDE